jgi:hypothetical protein
LPPDFHTTPWHPSYQSDRPAGPGPEFTLDFNRQLREQREALEKSIADQAKIIQSLQGQQDRFSTNISDIRESYPIDPRLDRARQELTALQNHPRDYISRHYKDMTPLQFLQMNDAAFGGSGGTGPSSGAPGGA